MKKRNEEEDERIRGLVKEHGGEEEKGEEGSRIGGKFETLVSISPFLLLCFFN